MHSGDKGLFEAVALEDAPGGGKAPSTLAATLTHDGLLRQPTMSHDLFSSLDSFAAVSSASLSLLVGDVVGDYRSTDTDEGRQAVLAGRVLGTEMLSLPTMLKDFLFGRG